jgi:hypothetical protein
LFHLPLTETTEPAYLSLLPKGAQPTQDIDEFLNALAARLGMLGRGGVRDLQRAADWFVRWWREDGGLLSARAPEVVQPASTQRRGWGFDLEWDASASEGGPDLVAHMTGAIDAFVEAEAAERAEGGGVSARQEKLEAKAAQREKSAVRVRALLAARKGNPSGGGGGKKKGGKRR